VRGVIPSSPIPTGFVPSQRSKKAKAYLYSEEEAALMAESLRAHRKEAGIRRPELFESSDTRIHMRAHDLRGTFVTLSLANGRSETWVADHTGHRSSTMINTYRRTARHAQGAGPRRVASLAPRHPGSGGNRQRNVRVRSAFSAADDAHPAWRELRIGGFLTFR